jgi:hypothetical protein
MPSLIIRKCGVAESASENAVRNETTHKAHKEMFPATAYYVVIQLISRARDRLARALTVTQYCHCHSFDS